MKDRRELLKGLAVGSVWATPVVSSVVLPVHASTSCSGGCFDAGNRGLRLEWDPEAGLVTFWFDSTDCTDGEMAGSTKAVIADSAAEAGLECGLAAELLNDTTDFPGPCKVWYCD